MLQLVNLATLKLSPGNHISGASPELCDLTKLTHCAIGCQAERWRTETCSWVDPQKCSPCLNSMLACMSPRTSVCVCVCVCLRCVFVCVCVCERVRACASGFSNILASASSSSFSLYPRNEHMLRRTDDFPVPLRCTGPPNPTAAPTVHRPSEGAGDALFDHIFRFLCVSVNGDDEWKSICREVQPVLGFALIVLLVALLATVQVSARWCSFISSLVYNDLHACNHRFIFFLFFYKSL